MCISLIKIPNQWLLISKYSLAILNIRQIAQISYVSMNNNWTISPIAYKKIAFHCLRYPSSKVYGALISNQSHQITNAYPLFHNPLLSPSLSIAMDLVESNLESNQSIIGFYQFLNEGERSPTLSRIISHQPNLKEMIVAKITTKDKELLVKIGEQVPNHPQFQELKPDLIKGDHWRIVDIDAHFEEIQLDFRNLYVK